MADKKSITKEEQAKLHEQGDPTLPPPGDERREILSMRRDELERLAEEAAIGAIAFGKDAFDVDREIQHGLANALTNLQEDKYVYKLVCDRQNGQDVWQAKVEGWEVIAGIQGDMVEAKGIIDAQGYRRIGDTILMRVPKERYIQIRASQHARAIQRDAAVSAQIQEVADEALRKSDGGIKLIDPRTRQTPRGPLSDVMSQSSQMRQRRMTPREAAIRRQAGTAIDKMIREGRVPGMKIPGGGGGK